MARWLIQGRVLTSIWRRGAAIPGEQAWSQGKWKLAGADCFPRCLPAFAVYNSGRSVVQRAFMFPNTIRRLKRTDAKTLSGCLKPTFFSDREEKVENGLMVEEWWTIRA